METDRNKLATELSLKLKQINEIDILEQMIKDNISEFVHCDKHYRVRKPTSNEKEAANKERMIKYFSMLKDSNYMFKKDLIELYKTKNIDIDYFDKEIKNLALREKDYLHRLHGNENLKDIEFLESEINKIQIKQQELYLEKDELLKYCIEQQLDDFLKFYLIYLVLEVKIGEKWERVYNSFNLFMDSTDEFLQAKAAQVLAVMVYNEKL
jgi:hypothetical protein